MDNVLNLLRIQQSLLNADLDAYTSLKKNIDQNFIRLTDLVTTLDIIKHRCPDVDVSNIKNIIDKEKTSIKNHLTAFDYQKADLMKVKEASLDVVKICESIVTKIDMICEQKDD